MSDSILLIDRTLSWATILGQSRLGSVGDEGIVCIPQTSSIIWASPSDCLMSYPGPSLGESYSSAESLIPLPTGPVNVLVELIVEVAYYDVTFCLVNHYITRISLIICVITKSKLYKKKKIRKKKPKQNQTKNKKNPNNNNYKKKAMK